MCVCVSDNVVCETAHGKISVCGGGGMSVTLLVCFFQPAATRSAAVVEQGPATRNTRLCHSQYDITLTRRQIYTCHIIIMAWDIYNHES